MTINSKELQEVIKSLGENPGKNRVLDEVSKALGYGPITTDIDQLRQGGAASSESLDPVVAEMILDKSSFEVVNSIKKSQAGQILDQWDETTDLGGADGMTISNMDGTTKEAVRSIRRRYDFIKFQTSRYSVNRPTVEAPNFNKSGLGTQDVDAVTRIIRDRAWQMYEGDDHVDPDQINGATRVIADTDRGNWDGRNVIDIATASGFSALDDDGFSNPADIEKAMISISRAISRPIVGIGKTPYLYMGPSVYRDLSEYKPFQAMQIQDGRTQELTTGFILSRIVNPFAGTPEKSTAPVVDNFLPDDQNEYFVSAEEKGTAVVVTLPTVTTNITTDTESRFDQKFAGSYNYFIAPLGRGLSDRGYEGVAARVAGVAVAAGKRVEFTITASSGALESGYAIYRTAPGAPNDIRHARLIKRIGRTGNVTPFVDKNRDLPGASKLYLMDWANPQQVMWRYLLSPSRINLPLNSQAVFNTPAVAVDSGYLQFKRSRHMGMITGYVSREAGFSPVKGLLRARY